MKRFVPLALVLMQTASQATTLDKVALGTFLHEADFVALVRIESAELLRAGREECGVVYRARVEEPIKGEATKGELVRFGPSGAGVGERLLIFLTKKEREFSAVASTNSASLEAEQMFEKACFEAMPPYRTMHEGFGSLPVSWTKKLDYKDGVLFMEEWVEPPPGLKKYKWEPGDNEIVSERSWIKLEEVIQLLRRSAANDR